MACLAGLLALSACGGAGDGADVTVDGVSAPEAEGQLQPGSSMSPETGLAPEAETGPASTLEPDVTMAPGTDPDSTE